jgi:hypothetical protein
LDLDDAALTATATDLCASPAWYPLGIADDLVSAVHLREADYAAASFLDERLLGPNVHQRTLSLRAVAAAAAQLRPRAHYLFHVGHVGSTLLSRLIGARPEFLSLREPALLRAHVRAPLPAGAPHLPLASLLALLARTWRAEQRAVVKATSIVNEIATYILAASETPRALLVLARPPAYLRTILGGPNSRIESRALAADRWRRLVRRHGSIEAGPPRTEGEWIAMSWLCETSALAGAEGKFPGQVQWVDFDEFLCQPDAGLASIFSTLGAACSPAEREMLLAGPIMRRYSKAPEHAYDAALRREVLAAADRDYGSEITRGMRWLEATGARDPAIGMILQAHA